MKERGQAIVEFVLILVVWASLLAGMVSLFQVGLLRRRAYAAARLGAFLLGSSRVDQRTAEAEISDHLSKFPVPGGGRWRWQLGRFTETPASRFYKLVQAVVGCEARGALPISERVVVQQENP